MHTQAINMYKQLKPLWDDFSYFSHQPPAIEWMLRQESEGATIRGVTVLGGILGDEMGLGKTIEMAGLIKNSSVKTSLILAPIAVIETWASVISRAGITVWTIRKGQWFPFGEARSGHQVYITNIDKLLFRTDIGERIWDRIIIDEAHRIRNPGSALAKACFRLNAKYRWALTATPIVNNMTDVLSLYAFLRAPVRRPLKWRPHMHAWTEKLVFHRSLDELRATLADAPPKPVTHKVICPFATKEEADFYYGIQGSIESKMNEYSRDIKNNAAIFKLLLRLRQISVHPQVYIEAMQREEEGAYWRDTWTGGATKFEAVGRLLGDKGHKTIIICHFRDEIDLLAAFITERGLSDTIFTYSGADTPAQREQTVKDATAAGPGAVIILQLQAGGVGINLQTFDRVVFLSPWWNAAMVDQAVGRAVRMGQRATVQVYHILFEEEEKMAGSIVIDRFMADKVEQKRDLLLNFWAGEETAKVKAKPLRPKKAIVVAEEIKTLEEDPIHCT